MKCETFINLLDAWMDHHLTSEQADSMKEHLQECEACAALYTLRKDCRALDEELLLPNEFSGAWRKRVREEKQMEKTGTTRRKWQSWVAAAAALVFVVGGTLLTRERSPAPSMATTNAVYDADRITPTSYEMSYLAGNGMSRSAVSNGMQYIAEESTVSGGAADVLKQEKIIRTVSFTIKTLTFDDNLAQLQALAEEKGGWVEYLSTNGDKGNGELRNSTLTLRIPSDQLDAFLEGSGSIGRMTAFKEESKDVTATYYDVQSRLETQRSKMDRLVALLASAEDMSDIIELESAISDTQYLIDSYSGQLKNYDSKADFSTVTVTLREVQVQEAEETTLGQRIVAGLRDSLEKAFLFLEDSLIFLVAALPWALTIGGIVLVIALIIKRKKV